jgi:hypothetical protein
MKILIQVILVLCSLVPLHAQQLVNGGFEEWNWDYTTPYPRPRGWECNNYKAHAKAEHFPVQACVVTRTGSFSIIIWPVQDTVTLNTESAHIWQSVMLKGQRPDILRFYTRYDIPTKDPASVEVEFFQSGKFLHRELMLITGMAHLDSFEEISMPINYTYQLAPDSAVVHIRSSVSENPSGPGNMVTVDDIQFIYNGKHELGDVFPNPVSGNHYILAEGFENTTLTIELFDIMGRLVNQKEYLVQSRTENIPLEFLPIAGSNYFYRIRSGSDLYVRKVLAQE